MIVGSRPQAGHAGAPRPDWRLTAMFALVVASGLAAPAFGVAISVLSGFRFPADAAHYLIRAAAAVAGVILLATTMLSATARSGIRLTGRSLILFYFCYIVVCSGHFVVSGMIYLDPVKYWIFVGPLTFLIIIPMIYSPRVSFRDAGLIVAYALGFSVAIFSYLFFTSGSTNLRFLSNEDRGGNVLILAYAASYCLTVWSTALLNPRFFGRHALAAIPFIVMAAYILLIAYSRGPLLSAALSIGCMTLLAKWDASSRLSSVFRVGFIVLLCAAGVFFSGSEYGDRLLSTADRVSDGGEERVFIWSSIWDASLQRVFGLGIEGPLSLHPHNLFVEIMMNMGLIGLAALIALSLVMFRTALRLIRGRDNIWVSGIFISSFVGAQFSSTLYLNTSSWMSFALVFSAVNVALRAQTPARSKPMTQAAGRPLYV